MATNDEGSPKTFNNIDSREQLMYVEVAKNIFAGYRRELLVYSLSELETDFYVCTECKGVMRNACQIGEEQNLVCEVCVKEGVPSQSMGKSRNKILELQAKCPLATRWCNWNGKMAEVEEHLNVCDKMVVNCNNACDVILPRSELDLHLIHSCVNRQFLCERCNEYFIYTEVTKHYLMCLEYQVPCPNNCNTNLKRKQLDTHLELECPNIVVECPYKKFGCEQEVLRCELEEHAEINQIKHLESTSIFAIQQMEQLKRTNMQLAITNILLTERVTTLENQVTSLTLGVEKLSYPIILRDELVIPNLSRLPSNFIQTQSVKAYWKFFKICLEFKLSSKNQIISVSVMENDDTRTPLANWPFEGRFKLTLIDNQNKSRISESDLIKLQPQNVSKDKGHYPSDFFLANIPHEDLQEDKFSTGGKFNFTLQIQDVENQ